jgi:hypothetical protein
MTRSLVLPILLLLAVGTGAGSTSYALHDAFDSLPYGPRGRGLFCYVGEPRDLADYQHRSDAIIRVRLGGRFRERVLFDARTETWDFREALVLETFKTTDDQPVVGDKIELVEWRGWTAPRAGVLTVLLTPFEALFPPTEWIVFTEWAAWYEAYEVMLGDEGAFQIRDGTIRMRTDSSWGMKWDGKPESVLLEQLR